MMNNSFGLPLKTAITMDSVVVVRGGREVLHQVQLSVGTGRVIGLLGPSGCGKTTLMRAVMGIQAIASGSVTVLGQPAGSAALRSRLGYAGQSPSVYADLSVRENLSYFAAALGLRGARRNVAVGTALEAVGLSDAGGQRVGSLSGGQRCRVSLAVALLGEPELLVLDEPTVGLDPLLRRQLWEIFASLAAAGTTLLISSHVMDEANRCQDLVLMREGRVIADGTTASILERTGAPDIESAFVALIGATV